MGKSYSQSIWNVLLTTVKNGYEKIKKVNLHLKKEANFLNIIFRNLKLNHKLLFQDSQQTGEIDAESRKYLTQFHSQRKPQLSLTRKETYIKSTARDEEKLEAQILNIHGNDKSKGKIFGFNAIFL